MAYKNWVIGGLTPSWVEPDFTDDRENRKLTLKCAAMYDETGEDPILEINRFNAISSETISNDLLLNGGSKLQVNNGSIFTVTDGINVWERCALHRVNVNLDSYYNEANPGSVIEYELVIEYETSGPSGSFVYTPDYGKYNNIEYYFWTDKTERITGDNSDGTELGWMKIIEPKNVKKIEVYGSACVGPGNYLDVNGKKEYWHWSHDYGWPDNTLPTGNDEKLTFELDPPTNEIILQTPNHVMPNTSFDENLGCWLKRIRVFYE